ncbi:HD-GYP domain-containing protein [Anaerospora sp.]|jgi:putative nucleotidyltransferase with HDIG domain|uniref:HD-GYP domain-containing protein n=1 Tax=Anaerospora sp. TaxID=1960278 RepID=UPI00289B360B|nr:HD-GYP domain-containing protein [Anaerospora sp.]
MNIQAFTVDDLHEIVDALSTAVDAKDPYTHGHSERVAHLAIAIARTMGMTREQQSILHIGAHLHDVGKIGVPDAVLCKPGRLTDEEYAAIKMHSMIGYNIVRKVRILHPVATIVRSHHERMDGRGYPDGLQGEEIPMEARIVAVADSYDAMTSQRLYKVCVSPAEAVNEVKRCAGTQFDADVVEAFNQLFASGALTIEQSA